MTAKSVLLRPQGLGPKARAPTWPHSLPTPLHLIIKSTQTKKK